MTHDEKKLSDQHIMKLIEKLTEAKDDQNAAMYIRGDSEFQEASFYIKGDFRLLAQTIQHHISVNDEFKKFIFAVVGSYLSQNPIEENEFIAGLELTKQTFGVN